MIKEILTVLSALLTLTIAVVGVIILVNQYHLERMRWRLALYDKRYPVFLKTMEFLGKIAAKHNVTNDELSIFLRESREKEFLFGKDVEKLLEQIYLNALNLYTIETELNSIPVGEVRNKKVTESSTLFNWFMAQFAICTSVFGEYLRVDEK